MTDINKSEYFHLSAHLNEIPICTSYAMTLWYSIFKFALQYHILIFDFNTCNTPSVQYKDHPNAVQTIKKHYAFSLQPSPLACCIVMYTHSHSHEFSLEWIKQCWRGRVEEQAGAGRLIRLTQGGGAQPGKATAGLVVEPVRESWYLCRWQDPPFLPP